MLERILGQLRWLSRLLHTFLRSFSTPRLTHNGYDVVDRNTCYPAPQKISRHWEISLYLVFATTALSLAQTTT